MSDNREPEAERPMPSLTITLPDHKVIYSDGFTICTTNADVNITFLKNLHVNAPDPQAGITRQIPALFEQITVAMTLPTLKALALQFIGVLEVIEEEIGPIRVSRSTVPTDAQMEIVRANLRSNPLVDTPIRGGGPKREPKGAD